MRTKIGVISSASMQKTVTVTVHRSVLHPMYEKRFRVTKKFLADTNGFDLHVGDQVVISECRPLSKRKCFKVTEILKKAEILSDSKMEDIEQVQHDHREAGAKKAKSESQAAA